MPTAAPPRDGAGGRVMKTENLDNASATTTFLAEELREAHSDAINAGDEFAEIVSSNLVERAAALEWDVRRALEAADPTQ